MRQLTFLFFFIVVLILVFFGMQNTETAIIFLYKEKDIKLEAPIAIEMILAMGVGAILAWLFAVWTGLQESVALSDKEKQIKALQKKVEELSLQAEKHQLMLQGAIDVEVEDKPKS
ncbi:MAG: LapA family protein [Pseudanabaenaceae cyanobacterium]